MASSLATQPETECPVCAGTGWKTIAVPGKASRVTRCDCRMTNRTQQLLTKARIPGRYEHCTLDDFVTDTASSHSSLSRAKLTCMKFVEECPLEKMGLLIVGPIGVGKTHFAVGIVKELILQKGISCLFYDYRELLKEIFNSYNDSVQATELSVLKPVFEAEILVLDDLGAVKPRDWVWDTVSFILNTRYNAKRTTIITTNFPDKPTGPSLQ